MTIGSDFSLLTPPNIPSDPRRRRAARAPLMRREQLRNSKGCKTCRRRRKKCDEVQPVCDLCARLRLSCIWHDQVTPQKFGAEPSQDPTRPLRSADYNAVSVGQPSGTFSLEVLQGGIDETVALCAAHDDEEIQHVLAYGMLHGWTKARADLFLDRTWDGMIKNDRFLETIGHGKAARMALIWIHSMICRYHASRGRSTIPAWLIPENSPQRISYIQVVFWPRIRARLAYMDAKDSLTLFAQVIMSAGRFIWPFAFEDAIEVTKGIYKASDEFTMRVSNIRSHVVTKDFLDSRPELRGDAPQYEPSITLYSPTQCHINEARYWQMLRERRQKGASFKQCVAIHENNYGTPAEAYENLDENIKVDTNVER